MSEIHHGKGYEELPEVPRRFVDFVDDHARQGEAREFGFSTAGVIYEAFQDRKVIPVERGIPFERVFFGDNRMGGIVTGNWIQKDEIAFYNGQRRVMMILHSLGYDRPNDDGFYISVEGSQIRPDDERGFVTKLLDNLVELEQSGRLVASDAKILPEDE